MKKKFFFKFFLFTVIATMVTFTACKDYDDDIDHLQDQITSLKATVDQIKTAIDAGKVIESVTSTANGIEIKVGGQTYTITNGVDGTNGADGADGSVVEIGENGNWYIDGVDTELPARGPKGETGAPGKDGADGKDGINGADGKDGVYYYPNEDGFWYMVDGETETKTEMTWLPAGTITAVYADGVVTLYNVRNSEGLPLDPITIDSSMNVKSMVTSVAIVSNSLIANNNELTKFSALTELSNVFVKDLPGAITFTKGKQTQTGDSFIIQVSPADANVTPEMITIQNGKGEVYDNLKVTKVERYSELLTRASTVNTGLWKVSVELIAYDQTAFDKATKAGGNKVAFAVAIGDDERRELSQYDLTLSYAGDYTPLGLLDFKVDDVEVADINNRYDNTSISLALTGAGTLYNEQTWKTLPATAMTGTNTVLHSADNRSLKDVYPAIQGKSIKISLNDPLGKIRGMYISLDYKDNAIDSAPSEWAAWNSFSYTGLNTIVEGTEAEFTINSEDAINDIIGFRVYAVNHDGTLVDPDGRAFYVSLGETGTDWSALNTVVTATKGQLTALGVKSANVNTTLTKLSGATKFEWVTDKADDAATTMPAFHAYFVDANDNVLFGTDGTGSINADFSKVTKVYTEATLNDWKAYKDNKEYKGALTIKNATNHVLSTVNVTFKKVLPTAGPTDFSVKTNQIVDGVYTAYLVPDTWAASSATAGTMPLSDLFNFGASAADIVTTFANSAPAPNSSVSITGAGLLSVGKSFVDNTTKHATKVAYSYGNISTATTGAYSVTIQEFQTVFSNIYNSTYSWSWDSAATTDVTYGDTGKTIDLADVNGKSSRDNVYNASLDAPYLGSLNVVSAKLVSNANQVAEYFTVTPDPLLGATVFTLTPASGATNPTADVASTLILTAKDMYDNDITIKLPFTVKKR